jgi:hypothetical protein
MSRMTAVGNQEISRFILRGTNQSSTEGHGFSCAAMSLRLTQGDENRVRRFSTVPQICWHTAALQASEKVMFCIRTRL